MIQYPRENKHVQLPGIKQRHFVKRITHNLVRPLLSRVLAPVSQTLFETYRSNEVLKHISYFNAF